MVDGKDKSLFPRGGSRLTTEVHEETRDKAIKEDPGDAVGQPDPSVPRRRNLPDVMEQRAGQQIAVVNTTAAEVPVDTAEVRLIVNRELPECLGLCGGQDLSEQSIPVCWESRPECRQSLPQSPHRS